MCADFERGLPATAGSSIFPCVQNMLLAAGALGLGSALTTLGAAAGEPLAALLGLPDHVVPQAIVPLGYPALSPEEIQLVESWVAQGRPR